MAKPRYSKLAAQAWLERYEQWCRENPEECRRIAEEVRLQYVCKKNSKRNRVVRGKAKGGFRPKGASRGKKAQAGE